jgi:GMP synthase-like glutamine amidotransferase
MRIVCLQHVAFEDAGLIAPWATARGHTLEMVRLDQGQPLPPAQTIDWAVVMGGPMSVHDEAQYPWLRDEKRWIAEAIARNRTVFGVCLGAQMIAQLLGARVYPNAHKEIGWFPVARTKQAGNAALLKALPPALTPFHWHGETFDIPAGAIHTFSSEACPHQSFIYSDRVVALQFHLEATPAGVQRLITHCPEDLAAGPFVQSASTMTGNNTAFTNAGTALTTLLNQLEHLTLTKGETKQ